MENNYLREEPYTLVCLFREEQLFQVEGLERDLAVFFYTQNEKVKMELEQRGFIVVSRALETVATLQLEMQKVVVLEDSLEDTLDFVEVMHMCTHVPIIVITANHRVPTRLYKEFGAHYVVFSEFQSIQFLID